MHSAGGLLFSEVCIPNMLVDEMVKGQDHQEIQIEKQSPVNFSKCHSAIVCIQKSSGRLHICCNGQHSFPLRSETWRWCHVPIFILDQFLYLSCFHKELVGLLKDNFKNLKQSPSARLVITLEQLTCSSVSLFLCAAPP